MVPRWKIFGVSLNPGPFTIKEHVIITIMSNVGAQSAYAVRLVLPFSTRSHGLMYWHHADGHCRGSEGVLQPEPSVRLPMDARHVYPDGETLLIGQGRKVSLTLPRPP